MGLAPAFSCSIYDLDERKQAPSPLQREKLPPNPNPHNFRLLEHHQEGGFLLVRVNYPDCTNYEGDKIMLYEGVTLDELLRRKSLDPHFSASKAHHSPIARFEPTGRGWKMGILMMKGLGSEQA